MRASLPKRANDLIAAVDVSGKRSPVQWPLLVVGAAGLATVSATAFSHGGWRLALLPIIGAVAGWTLQRAAFGFSSAWRALLTAGQTVGVRAQLVMVSMTIVLFFPLLWVGEVGGQVLFGFVNPVGVALALGAFLFGIGMQLGGGCGSGTLYTAAGGSARTLVTLAAFIAGSVLAAADVGGWSRWPTVGVFDLRASLGTLPSLALFLILIGFVYGVLLRLERRRTGRAEPIGSLAFPIRGRWSLLAAAMALSAVNVATLLLSGQPWGITSAFALWGSKIVALAGVDVANWPYWTGDPALGASVFADATSVTNFGLMLGAFSAAAIAGTFRWAPRLPLRTIAASVTGGLLMGFGARLATGCNIGAFFSGMASGSVHGILWLAFALVGCAVGIRFSQTIMRAA